MACKPLRSPRKEEQNGGKCEGWERESSPLRYDPLGEKQRKQLEKGRKSWGKRELVGEKEEAKRTRDSFSQSENHVSIGSDSLEGERAGRKMSLTREDRPLFPHLALESYNGLKESRKG